MEKSKQHGTTYNVAYNYGDTLRIVSPPRFIPWGSQITQDNRRRKRRKPESLPYNNPSGELDIVDQNFHSKERSMLM